MTESDDTKLFVYGFSQSDEVSVRKIFEQFGEISSIKTFPGAYVIDFAKRSSARNAYMSIYGSVIGEQEITLQFSQGRLTPPPPPSIGRSQSAAIPPRQPVQGPPIRAPSFTPFIGNR